MRRSLVTKWLLVGLLVSAAVSPALAGGDRWKVRVFGARVTSGADQTSLLLAEEAESLFTATIDYSFLANDGSIVVVPVDQDVRGYQVDPGSGQAFGVSAEFRVIDRIGVEAGWITGSTDNSFATVLDDSEPIIVPGLDDPVVVPASVQTSGYETDVDQTYLAVNFHLIDPARPVDVYFGPVFAQVDVGDATTLVPGGTLRIRGDDGSGLGLQVGLDAQIKGSAWFFHAGIRYVDTDVTLTFEGDDPIVFPQIDAGLDPWTLAVGGGYRF